MYTKEIRERRMRILFLAAANSIHTIKWVNSMSKKGHEVFLVCNKGHEPSDNVLSEDVKLYCLKYGGTLAYYLNAFELRKKVQDIKADIIHVHYASGYGTLARVAKVGPILLSVWGSDVYEFPNESKAKKIIFQRNIRYAKQLASTSECMANELRNVMKNSSLKVKITPFGVDTKCFDSDKYPKKKSHLFVIGNIKSLKPVYGIREFIYVIKELVEDSDLDEEIKKRIRVEIYGDGEQKQELYNLIHSLGLVEFVYLMGKIPNNKVPNVLSQFDIFCAMSQRESFGVSLVEAMSMKKPVVASNVDGFKEVIDNEITGIIVDKNDTVQCKEALKRLILDEVLREKMGENGRFYDWEKNVDYMESIYREFSDMKLE